MGLAIDKNDNVFAADSDNGMIRMIDPTGLVTTPFSQIGVLTDVALDSSGNLFITDYNNHAIRMIASGSTTFTTLAGDAGTGSADGTGNSASFNYPKYLTLDVDGNVFVSDTGNGKVRKVTPLGVVTTFATMSSYLAGLAFDVNGNLFVGTNDPAVFEYTPAGIISSTTGSVNYGYADGSGTNAQFASPKGMDFDSSGNLYIADSGNNLIRMMDPNGAVTTYAGIYANILITDGSQASQVYLSNKGIACDVSGNLYLTTSTAVWKVSPMSLVTILAGKQDESGVTDGTGTDARFSNIFGVAVDPTTDNVVVADWGASVVRVVTPTGTITTLAGSTSGYANGMGANAKFTSPSDVAVDTNGITYVTDPDIALVRKILPTGEVSDFAGGKSQYDNVDGVGTSARFAGISGMGLDSSSNIYVSDSQNQNIRKISPTGAVTTLAGSTTTSSGYFDAIGTSGLFFNSKGISVDPVGNVYVVDSSNYCIRKISPSTALVTTIAGYAGNPGSIDSTGTNIRFLYPSKIAVDSNGIIFVVDYDIFVKKLQRV